MSHEHSQNPFENLYDESKKDEVKKDQEEKVNSQALELSNKKERLQSSH